MITATVTPEGKVDQMGQVNPLTKEANLSMQWTELPNFLLKYSEYGFSAELLGIENINGVEYYVIHIITMTIQP